MTTDYTKEQIEDLIKENNTLKEELSKETIRKEESYRHEDFLSAENKELRRTKFKNFNEEECWIFNEDGDNYLRSLICPVCISPVYLQTLFENLWELQMYMDIVLDEEGFAWDTEQYVNARMCSENAKVLLKAFENENDKGSVY